KPPVHQPDSPARTEQSRSKRGGAAWSHGERSALRCLIVFGCCTLNWLLCLPADSLADRPMQDAAGWCAHGDSMPLLQRKIRHHKHTTCGSGRPEDNLDRPGSPGDVVEVLCIWMRDLCRP